MLALNIGSGQRPFDQAAGWVNIDGCLRPPDQVPDLLLKITAATPLPYDDASVDYVVLHQVYEHFGLGEGHGLLREIHRVLKPGSSLIITVPDMRALAARWLAGAIDNYIYFVNVYGAYQGSEDDRHKWGYDAASIRKDVTAAAQWTALKYFDWRDIPGANIARAWWILGIECVK